MTAATSTDGVVFGTPADVGKPVDKRAVLTWEVITFVVVMLGASALHFAFELSGFYQPLAIAASVNESTFEHLKLFFWPALIVTLVLAFIALVAVVMHAARKPPPAARRPVYPASIDQVDSLSSSWWGSWTSIANTSGGWGGEGSRTALPSVARRMASGAR